MKQGATEYITLLSMLYAHVITLKALNEWEEHGMIWKQKIEQKEEDRREEERQKRIEKEKGIVRYGTSEAMERVRIKQSLTIPITTENQPQRGE